MNIKLSKLNNIQEKFIFKAYAIWNIKAEYWVLEHNNLSFCPGIWANKEQIPIKYINDKYEILEIDFSNNIPEDILRILSFDDILFTEEEKKNMVFSKLRQLFYVFLINNKTTIDSMKSKYRRLNV